MRQIHGSDAIYEFGGFRFDPLGGLERAGTSIHLAPLEHRALEVLLTARGRVVEKDAFAQAAWNGGTPSDYSIARCVHLLRRALAHPDAPDVIETFHGRGYRIAVPVRALPDGDSGAVSKRSERDDPSAGDALPAARELVGRRTPEELAAAVAILADALRRNPRNAPALAMTAEIRTLQAVRRHLLPRDVAPQIVQAANAALTIDPEDASALAARGWALALVGWDYAAGLKDVDRALALDPHHVRGRNVRWWILSGLGRNDDALAECASAAEVCPLSPWIPSPLAWSHVVVGQIYEGLDIIRRATSRFPTLDMVYQFRCLIAACVGEHDEAIAAGERAVNLSQGAALAMAALAHAYANAGRNDEARMVMRWIKETPLGAPPSLMVPVHAALGETDAALAALARAGEERCPWLALASADPRNAPLRAHPEFARLATTHRPRMTVAA